VTKLRGIPGPFELALDLGCFHGVPARAGYLAQLTRVLAPSGYWLLYGMLRDEGDSSRPGIAPSDMDLISAAGLAQRSRTDGWDKRGRPSAWFLYQRPAAKR
jgi:hypothetical protein